MTQPQSRGSLISKIGSYLQIVTKDPRSTAFVPLAEAYRQVGLLDDALEAARLGTSMLPHFSPGFAAMGRILGQMGRIDEAMSAYAKALSIDRQSQAALVGLARLHLIRAERDQARKILRQAAEFHPEDHTVQNMLTALDLPRPWAELKQAPEVQDAVADTSGASEETTAEPIPTATLAEIYVKQGLMDKAITVYQQILQQNPDNSAAEQRLTELRYEANAPAEPDLAPVPEEPQPEPVPETASTPAPGAATVTQPDEEKATERRPVLKILENWLAVIRQGRADV